MSGLRVRLQGVAAAIALRQAELARLREQRVELILRLLGEGVGPRAVARDAGVNHSYVIKVRDKGRDENSDVAQ